MKQNLLIKSLVLAMSLFLVGCGVETPPTEVAHQAMKQAISQATMGMADASFANLDISDCEKFDLDGNAELTVDCEVSAEVSFSLFGMSSGDPETITERIVFEKRQGQWFVIG
ncbi:hypothetical protein [Shewanella sp. 4_MG-2023]|uniref:hypothetical protein n=1 Tax=Shewanella sp. 4_MG-2023 TaxID=3062652 RepID=UPI0026E130AD|nr:hypothetical protein [Shewanella sp. 4_MG-2023]MDO6677080.1 hypothetical protein [Shewanella sp. 4_MG-2023]